ncbi:RidA family protein [Nitratireductor aquimarinus]|uniref:RidA family protein n=1 Tax=Nitratireductor TaxID=245876 RepID=UPI0019D3F23B|nr:RidA family protein [Nitratireductor aquibiodomus]MBN7776234.1 RidA family protein [Nitratireductor pacificus]MBN7779101.1 RidA family protein [Nitratireductor pacificus]MBN7787908.1 RidA family protein [Nitratireductor aquimarinus]MBY6097955.1 RidA family protein [Nitratireductor aquimarinus]
MHHGGRPICQKERRLAIPVNPGDLPPPFSNYSHAMQVPEGARLLVCSGQLGMRTDGTIPDDTAQQARICFDNIRKLLKAADMDFEDVVRISAFVTGREHMAPYMDVRNALFPAPYPASTLMIVSGFTKPEFTVEVEVLAAKRD